ncbi:MAG: DGQHR domain-containing protein [Acidobacteriaceae bacterium]|nr:DGQHR domain-containing protein [Acidobacteriaceae bacterium]
MAAIFASHDKSIVPVQISGIIGRSANRKVLLGFAPANVLYSISYADVLNEDTGHGYQRRFNSQHSLDFRKYIQQENSATIPLTFNARPRSDGAWRLSQSTNGTARLVIKGDAGKLLTQVDCQHRLGYLNDVEIELPFMCFLGLTEREEMEVFNVINSKAKGLSTSLLDFHDATLATDLASERPELFIALHLNNNTESPWYRQLDLGGSSTSGLMRRASLRTMQKAIKHFLAQTKIHKKHSADISTRIVLDFWSAVAEVLRESWDNPRHSLINKGVGVYALMVIAGDLYTECSGLNCDKRYFTAKLAEFISEIDWSNKGPLKGFGGEGGVASVVSILRDKRHKRQLKVVH